MIRLRTRDRGFHNPLPDLLFILLIIVILAAIAIPALVQARNRGATTCLGNLLAMADGKPPEKAGCPVSDKAYVPGPDLVTCPSPEKHLDSKPSLVRIKEGSWQLRQTLPSSTGRPIDFRISRLEVKESPGRTAVLVKPGTLLRFVLGPLSFLFFLAGTLTFLFKFLKALRSRKWVGSIAPLIGLAVAAGLGFLTLGTFARSHEWILERAGARVTRVEYFLGARTSERTISGCLGVVPTAASGGHWLQLLHRPDQEGRRMTELGLVAKDRLDIADWFNRALVGP